jgi:hypothetical protein
MYDYFSEDHDDDLESDSRGLSLIGDRVGRKKENFIADARELGMEENEFMRGARRAKKEASQGFSSILTDAHKTRENPLWREEKREQEKADYQDKIKKGYDDFYARHNDPRPLSSRRRKLHTRNSGLRKAKKLRRMGFTRAAEKAAMDWSDSTESDRSAISTPAMREQENADHRQQRRNQGVIDRLIQRLDQ